MSILESRITSDAVLFSHRLLEKMNSEICLGVLFCILSLVAEGSTSNGMHFALMLLSNGMHVVCL